MSKKVKRNQKIRNNPHDIRFSEAISWIKDNGFEFDRQEGSHQIFINHETGHRVNFQEVHGKAKGYQIIQAIKKIDGSENGK